MDRSLLVLAGSHMTGCAAIRSQLLAVRADLDAQGIHLPSFVDDAPDSWHNLAWELADDPRHEPGRGSLATAVSEARQVGAETLLLASEAFEHPLRRARKVAALVDLARRLDARVQVVMVLRHQVPYLNLVHAHRAIEGRHLGWFEDFARAPTPLEQFRYPIVIAALMATPGVDLALVSLEEVQADGGLPALLAAGGLAPSLPRLPFSAEFEPDATEVDMALMARRLFAHRHGDGSDPGPASAVRAVLEASRADRVSRGAYWGWTSALLEETADRFRRDNERIHDVTGLVLRPPPERPPNRLVVREASVVETMHLVDALERSIPHTSSDLPAD